MTEKERRGCCNNCCPRFSVFFLVSVNFVIGLLGVTIVAFSGYAFANFSEFDEVVSQQAIIYSISAGIIVLLLGVTGIFGALFRLKKLLAVYVFFLLAITIGELVIVALTLEYSGVLEGTSDNAEEGGSLSLSGREQIINDFLLRSYDTCCFLDEAICSPTDPNPCTRPVSCAQEGAPAVCVVKSNAGEQIDPVDQSVCTALERLSSDLVGQRPACGDGSPETFLDDVAAFIHSQLRTIAIVGGVLVLLEFMLILFTMFLLFGKRVDYSKSSRWGANVHDAVIEGQPLTQAELRRLSVQSARPISFGNGGSSTAQTRNSQRLSLQREENRRSLQRRSQQRRSQGRASSDGTNNATTQETAVISRDTLPSVLNSQRLTTPRNSLLASTDEVPSAEPSIPKEEIANNSNVIDSVI